MFGFRATRNARSNRFPDRSKFHSRKRDVGREAVFKVTKTNRIRILLASVDKDRIRTAAEHSRRYPYQCM